MGHQRSRPGGSHKARSGPRDTSARAGSPVFAPLPAIWNPGCVASNQEGRADNVLHGTLAEQVSKVWEDIRAFKRDEDVDLVVVVWSASTEKVAKHEVDTHGSSEGLMRALDVGDPSLSPSLLYGIAAVDEGCPFINSAAQNTFCRGLVEMAIAKGVCFKSKEATKTSAIDSILATNPYIFEGLGWPDHVVVIKNVPAVGDSKRAMDEYENEIFLGGKHTVAIHSTCEDSLLAAPLLLDVCVIAELASRVRHSVRPGSPGTAFVSLPFRPFPFYMGYFFKLPAVSTESDEVDVDTFCSGGLSEQWSTLVGYFSACAGLPGFESVLSRVAFPSAAWGE
jgi:myo-inositol-1-phosphate synthase